MTPPSSRNRFLSLRLWWRPLAWLLALQAGLLGWSATRHSPAIDEVGHLGAGLPRWHPPGSRMVGLSRLPADATQPPLRVPGAVRRPPGVSGSSSFFPRILVHPPRPGFR